MRVRRMAEWTDREVARWLAPPLVGGSTVRLETATLWLVIKDTLSRYNEGEW